MYIGFRYLKATERQRTLHFDMSPSPKTLNHRVVRSAYQKVIEDLSLHKEPGSYPSSFWGSLHLDDREIRFNFLTDKSVTSEEEIDAVLDRQIARLKKAYGYNFQGIADLLAKHLEAEMQNHNKNETLRNIMEVWTALDRPSMEVLDAMLHTMDISEVEKENMRAKALAHLEERG